MSEISPTDGKYECVLYGGVYATIKLFILLSRTPKTTNEDAIKRAKEEANLHAVLYKPWSDKELFTIIKSGLEKNE